MAEIQLQRIKSIYGEIYGILSQLEPAHKATYYSESIANHFNSAVDELSKITSTDYGRHKITQNDASKYSDENDYDAQIVRSRIGSVVSRLEYEYGLGRISETQSSPILNITNTNQMQITIINVDQLIEETNDVETKNLLKDIKDAVQSKNKESTRSLLKTLLDMSWDLFLRVLPWVLEQWSIKA